MENIEELIKIAKSKCYEGKVLINNKGSIIDLRGKQVDELSFDILNHCNVGLSDIYVYYRNSPMSCIFSDGKWAKILKDWEIKKFESLKQSVIRAEKDLSDAEDLLENELQVFIEQFN